MPLCVSLKQLSKDLNVSEDIDIEPFFRERLAAERLLYSLGWEIMGGSISLSLVKYDGDVRSAMVGSRAIRLLATGQIALAAVMMLATAALGAEITGETHTPPAPELAGPEPVEPAGFPGGSEGGTTIIDFSILPDPDDPTKMETQIFVRRTGGRDLCLQLRSDDLISRSYKKRGEEPFTPSVPGRLRAQTSGQTGALVGFNELKVFIKPDSPEYDFALNECFVVGSASGCFVEDLDDCDIHLEENAEVCVSGSLSGRACAGTDHASAFDTFKKMMAANESVVITTEAAPLETAAGEVAEAPEVAGPIEAPSAEAETTEAPPLVSEPTVTDPVTGGVIGGGGGGAGLENPKVPNLIGLTVAQGKIALENASLAQGSVTIEGGGVVVRNFSIIRSAYAQFQPGVCDDPTVPPGTYCAQSLNAGDAICEAVECPVKPGQPMDCVVKSQGAIPEPAVLPIFLTGLVLLLLVVWRSRSRARSS